MNEACFIYEDTFLNLLTLILYLTKNNIKPTNIKNTTYTPNLLDNIVALQLEENENAIKKIIEDMGAYAFRSIYYVFLSNIENKELILYYFILNGFKYKEKVMYHRNLKCVAKTIKIAQYVLHESHKYKGFLRFKELENHILYAEIEPVNDVLILVSHHFKKRLKNEYWIIKDVKRGILCIYDKKNVYMVLESGFKLETTMLSREETKMENLWKTFYNTIGIKERKNDRCRMNFMPKKYWKYMIEMEGEV